MVEKIRNGVPVLVKKNGGVLPVLVYEIGDDFRIVFFVYSTIT